MSPARAVVLVVPSCNKFVSPSKAVPADVPKPGNDVLAVLAVIALACAVEIVVVLPAKAVVPEVPNWSRGVLPSNDVPAVVPNPGKETLSVLAATLVLADTRASV